MPFTRPRLPRDLATAVTGHTGTRHPFLMQGPLFLHWQGTGPGYDPMKAVEAATQASKLQAFFDDHAVVLQAIAQRQREAAAMAGMYVRTLQATAVSPVLIGSGLPNQLEVGLLLHPLYGVPYLPGSALKGVTRSTLLEGWAAEAGIGPLPLDAYRTRLIAPRGSGAPPFPPTPLEAFEGFLLASHAGDDAWMAAWSALQEALTASGNGSATAGIWLEEQHGREKGKLFAQLFGWPPVKEHDPDGHRGEIIFFDAFPTKLEAGTGVLTPHGGAYAREARTLFLPGAGADAAVPSPSDVYEPVPVPYVVIKPDSVFRVTVASRDHVLADVAANALTRALEDAGIGAKGGAGYGVFSVKKG